MTGEHLRLLDRIEGVACPRCQGGLFPITTSETPEGFAFACSDAHIVCLRELFAVHPGPLKKSLDGLIKSWEEAVRRMVDAAEMARQKGFLEVADRFARRIGDVNARIRTLRDVFRTPKGGDGLRGSA